MAAGAEECDVTRRGEEELESDIVETSQIDVETNQANHVSITGLV